MQDLKTTARITGLAYLGLAVTGMVGFLAIRASLYVPDNAAATLSNLTGKESLARYGIVMDLAIVVTQALAALWFFKLFRASDSFAAGAIAAFGMMNSAIILVGTVFTATALAVALDPALAPGGDQAATVQLLYKLSGGAWSTGTMFFGLWLIPMGYAVLKSRLMPRLLGAVLIAGGVGYMLSGIVKFLLPDAPGFVDGALTSIASIGELWIVLYLLIFGVRTTKPAA